MAKSKHTINDIQKALLSSTKFIKENSITTEPEPPTASEVQIEREVNIDPVTMKKLKILAPYLGESTDELINKALSHFLRLKSVQLEQAMMKLTEGE